MPGPPPAMRSRTRLEDQHLSSERLAREARGVVHGIAEKVIGFADSVACVNTDPDADWRRGVLEHPSDPGLDLLRTRNRPPRTREREHRAITLGLDDAPALSTSGAFDDRVVLPKNVEPDVIAEPVVQDGRVDDVREHDRHRAVRGKRGRKVG